MFGTSVLYDLRVKFALVQCLCNFFLISGCFFFYPPWYSCMMYVFILFFSCLHNSPFADSFCYFPTGGQYTTIKSNKWYSHKEINCEKSEVKNWQYTAIKKLIFTSWKNKAMKKITWSKKHCENKGIKRQVKKWKISH